TVSITINPANDAPVANPQSVSTNEDTPIVIVLSGSDIDGNSLTFFPATTPVNGTLSSITQLTATTAQVTYTPNLNFNGGDNFTFRTNDGSLNSAPATVSITINPVNDAPVAVDDVDTIGEDGTLVRPFGVYTSNDTDVDGQALTIINA